MNEWGGKPLPISATAHHDGELRIRLSGAPAALASAASVIRGTEIDARDYWNALRDQRLEFFRPAIGGDATLWRLSVRSTAPMFETRADTMLEWGGALRWVLAREPLDAQAVRAWAAQHGGHATLFRANDKSAGAFQPLPATLEQVHVRLKQVFDPHGILNPGRMYKTI
jgi:glycolate oxidase FAD binding subunit